MITNIRAFQEVLKRNNLPTPDTYLGISELIRSLYRPDVSPNPERIREVLEELTWPVTVPGGNPITFKSCSEVLASEAVVTFTPKQSGSGDPSPDNVRPIIGWDSLHLYVDEEQSASPATTYTATFDSTVYGGSYDFVSGKGRSNMNIVNMGNMSWTYNSSFNVFICYPSGKANGIINLFCDRYKVFNGGFANMPDKSICGNSANSTVYVKDTDYDNVTDFKTAVSDGQIAYELATPTEITLTPEDIELLRGVNTIWTDGDNVTVKFQTLT